MNRFKKILISVASVFALGSSIMAMPISADYDGTTENGVTFGDSDETSNQLVAVVEDGESSTEYYFDFENSILTLIDENFTIDTSNIEKVYIDAENRGFYCYWAGRYVDMVYSFGSGEWDVDLIDDTSVGDSTVTGLRGDVNLDGEVNGLDLLMLKKYIIGLISW